MPTHGTRPQTHSSSGWGEALRYLCIATVYGECSLMPPIGCVSGLGEALASGGLGRRNLGDLGFRNPRAGYAPGSAAGHGLTGFSGQAATRRRSFTGQVPAAGQLPLATRQIPRTAPPNEHRDNSYPPKCYLASSHNQTAAGNADSKAAGLSIRMLRYPQLRENPTPAL